MINLTTSSDRCETVTTTTILTINPTEIIIPVVPPDNKLEFFDDTTGISSEVFVLSGSANDYTVSWSDGSPPNLSFIPPPGNVGTTTVTLSGNIAAGLSSYKSLLLHNNYSWSSFNIRRRNRNYCNLSK